MRRVCHASGWAMALFTLVAGQPARGERIITVLSDWGTSVCEGKMLGYTPTPIRWVSSYQGPFLMFTGLTVQQDLDLDPGGLHTILAAVTAGTGPIGLPRVQTAVAVSSEAYTSYGRAEAHFNLNFTVPDEAVPFTASADLENGVLDYSLFDVTAGSSVFDWHYSGFMADNVEVSLLPGHTYWLSLNSRAEAQGSADPMSQAFYDFDAIIAPEPTTLLLLGGMAMLGLYRRCRA